MSRSETFRQIFDRLYLPVSMYALRITGDTDIARDAVQEAMVALWQKMSGDDTIVNPASYLYRCCRNKALSLLTIDHVGIEDLEDVTEEEIDTSERDARIWEAIGELPEKMRTVFLMSKRDGMKYKEIAEELGISEKTVENQVSGALKRLREALGPKPAKVFFLPFL